MQKIHSWWFVSLLNIYEKNKHSKIKSIDTYINNNQLFMITYSHFFFSNFLQNNPDLRHSIRNFFTSSLLVAPLVSPARDVEIISKLRQLLRLLFTGNRERNCFVPFPLVEHPVTKGSLYAFGIVRHGMKRWVTTLQKGLEG